MTTPDFAYAIYIRATREAVWRAFLEPEHTRRYWVHDNVSDWQVGSEWQHRRSDGSDRVDIAGKVLESEPHRRLVLSWSRPGDAVRVSKLTLRLEDQDWPGGPWTAVSLEHTELGDDDEMRHGISAGWPMVMSGMKTLLEAGLREDWVLPEDV